MKDMSHNYKEDPPKLDKHTRDQIDQYFNSKISGSRSSGNHIIDDGPTPIPAIGIIGFIIGIITLVALFT